jgi:hypothetical protein
MAVDAALKVEPHPTKRQRDEKLRQEMISRGENPSDEGCAAEAGHGLQCLMFASTAQGRLDMNSIDQISICQPNNLYFS